MNIAPINNRNNISKMNNQPNFGARIVDMEHLTKTFVDLGKEGYDFFDHLGKSADRIKSIKLDKEELYVAVKRTLLNKLKVSVSPSDLDDGIREVIPYRFSQTCNGAEDAENFIGAIEEARDIMIENPRYLRIKAENVIDAINKK